ncbi:MAG TPA: carboxypeptidase-like regulatory domain-containing protein [Acidobacteriota bacterium]|nr:carboxypeptidase-like regulatory domain-containing protein [Acidobacteriota bacterium]
MTIRKTAFRFSLAVLIFLVSIFGCSNSVPFPTGVNGVAILQSGGGNVFPPPPITHGPLEGATITVQQISGGQVIAQAVSDSTGGFRIEVPPGAYMLSAQAPEGQRPIIAPPQQNVVVVQHQLTQVVCTFNQLTPF